MHAFLMHAYRNYKPSSKPQVFVCVCSHTYSAHVQAVSLQCRLAVIETLFCMIHSQTAGGARRFLIV